MWRSFPALAESMIGQGDILLRYKSSRELLIEPTITTIRLTSTVLADYLKSEDGDSGVGGCPEHILRSSL